VFLHRFWWQTGAILIGVLMAFGVSPLGKRAVEKIEYMFWYIDAWRVDMLTVAGKATTYQNQNFVDIGKVERTPVGVLSRFPAGFRIGACRPDITDIIRLKALRLLPALIEVSLLDFVILTGIYRIIRFRIRLPVWAMSWILGGVFAAALIGFMTPNFGALVRYRMPVMIMLGIPMGLTAIGAFGPESAINETKKETAPAD
jgi:hypothetical protein